LHVELEDKPGRLGDLATAVGTAGCNIVSLHVVGEPADDGAVTDELLVRVPDAGDPADLITEVERAGIPCTLLVRADATELSDPATTALALARMVAADPGCAPRAVATMLRARLVDPEATGPGSPPHVHPLRIGGQQLYLGRAWTFTAAELSRAAALLELAAQLELRVTPRAAERSLLLADGSEVRVRSAGTADAPLVRALHAVCSPQTRRSRFLPPAAHPAPDELAALHGVGAVLALTADGGSAVAVANLDREEPGAARVSLLVADAWQGRGLGTALLRMAAETAAAQGVAELVASARTEDLWITKLFRRAGLRPSAEIVEGRVRLRAPLPISAGHP
jgi:GNAT superfamily N-acetyltransferase